MQSEVQQMQRYLLETLGLQVTTLPWTGANRLPPFLRDRYSFARMMLLETPCLLAIDAQRSDTPPAVIRKHLEILRAKQDAEVIYVRPQVTAYNRKRLIEHKVPFIVPGTQMYLPMLAIDLREHFRRAQADRTVFSPATQVVLLHTLLHRTKGELTALEMAQRLGYSAMTMSRAFDELESANLGRTTVRGRERWLRFGDSPKDTWAQAQPLLRSPVTKRVFIQRGLPDLGLTAGLTALSNYSMLAPPAYATLAVGRERWNEVRQRHKPAELPTADPDGQEIEIWSYPPALLAHRDVVDPLSLYLSLKEDRDERTQAALEEMMRTIPW